MAARSRRRFVASLLRGYAALPLWPMLPAAAAPGPPTAPLFDGLDSHHFAADTRHPLARRYLDQGMLLVYGFNPAEGARSFEEALALDPGCAAGWWALAWALGPTINADMAPAAKPRLEQALAQARRLARQASPVQRGLISALSRRHPGTGVIDEAGYDRAMRALARHHPDDALVALLAAEALLNLHPYDWWTSDGQPQPWTPEIERQLQRALVLDPQQPGAHHYAIHLQESGPQPARAVPSADHLRAAVPGSGHLLHMPAHIDLRVGRYDDAIRASQRSIEADRRYLAQVDAQGAYRVGYVAHNHQFLWAAACMAGRQALALAAAQAAWPAACGPSGRAPDAAIVQQYAVLPLFTLLRFGQWDSLLRGTLPPDGPAPYPLAIWHFAHGTALARTGDLDAAQRELDRLQTLAADPALDGLKIKNINPALQLLQIAERTLQADIALTRGQALAAVAVLQDATRIEDGLAYDEPHLWLAPTRHALGAALLAAGQPAQAEQVYRQDLAHYPDNGWSLTGLSLAQARQGQVALAEATAQRARSAFGQAERRPDSSRF